MRRYLSLYLFSGVIIGLVGLAVIVSGISPALAAKKTKKTGDSSDLRPGIEAYQADKWKTVIKKLKSLTAEKTALPDYVLFMLATAERHEGQCKKAASHFARVNQDYPKSVYATDSLLEEARAHICDKNFETGRAKAQSFIKTRPITRRKQETLLLIAKSYLAEGDKETARQKLVSFWVDSKDNDLSEEAFKQLKKSGGRPSRDEKWRRAQHLFKMREWVEAKNMLVELGAQDSYLFANCIFRLRDYPRAKKLFQSLVDRGVSSKKALSKLATINVRIGNYNEAIKHNLLIAKKYAGSSHQRKALKKVASLHRDSRQFKKAAKILQELLQKPLRRKEKIDALQDYAWVSYRADDYESAIKTLDDLLEMKINRKAAAKFQFWKGKFLTKKGDQEKDKTLKKEIRKEAKKAFHQSWNEDKWSYYGLASLRALNKKEKKFFSALKVKDQQRARRIRRVSVDASPSLNGLFHLPRAEALYSMGFKRLASKEMKAAFKEAKGSPSLMKLVGEISYSVGNYYVPMVVALRKPGLMDRPEEAWGWIYPEAYRPIVERHSGRRKLDPLLVYSMMRQESAFQEQVVSSAGARGLIQIMPFTGRRLSRIMGWKGFKTIDLFEPEINIALSTLYIKMNSDLFDGHLPAVIASYNAGEHAVARWLPSRQRLEYWEFMEEIPYKETNKYTKKVMRNYWMYQYLHPEKGSKATKEEV